MNTTIIIPVYNGQEWLADAIQSAVDQTQKCEVIVINDGSTDKSAEIAKSFPVRLINQVNKGLPSARNTGIMAAATEYIMPLDADDILQENCVERLETIAKETGADIVSPSFKCFGIAQNDIILQQNPTMQDFKTANRLPYFSLVKREALIEVGGYNPKMLYGWEDYDLWIDLLKRGKKLVTLPEKLVLYRTKQNSMYTESVKKTPYLTQQMYQNHPEVYA